MKRTKLRLGQVKVTPAKGELAANFSLLETIVRDEASQTLDVIVTPECFLDGYLATEKKASHRRLFEYAVSPGDSPYIREVADLARKQKCWFLLGCMRKEKGDVFNSVLIFDRAGQLAGWYDKTHCQTHDRKFTPGKALPVFSSDFGPFGVMVCADRRWPETVRTLSLKGARVIFNPSWGMHDQRKLEMMKTRSYESEVVIVFTHPEQALVTGPDGEVISFNQSRYQRLVVTEVDLTEVDRTRSGECSHLRDRRPEIYHL
ncbi:MAG TPA: carbon-nitrogen hydrolase family protein [bacterium]|nr:carbon-nitrogen hydrolase family protein [bacterium]